MEFIPQNIFDTSLGKEFLLRVIYIPQLTDAAKSFGLSGTNPSIEGNKTIYDYAEVIVYGGSIDITKFYPKTIFDESIGELVDCNDPDEYPELTNVVEIISDGSILENFKKKIDKLNDKLTNLKDCLTSIVLSTTSYVAAVAIPFSMAAGIAGILSTIGQLKNLKTIIGDVRDLLEELNLSGDTLDSLIPGAGTAINAVLDLIENLVGTLTSIIPV